MAKSEEHVAFFKGMANDPAKFKAFSADPHGAMKAAGLDHTHVSDEHAAAITGGSGQAAPLPQPPLVPPAPDRSVTRPRSSLEFLCPTIGPR